MPEVVQEESGPALHTYLERVWTSQGLSEHAWCAKVGLSQSTVNRLSRGSTPTFELCRRIADGGNLPIVDLLLVAGLLRSDEVAATASAPAPPVPPDLLTAIEGDPTLRDDQRLAFRAVYGAVVGQDAPVVRTRKRR